MTMTGPTTSETIRGRLPRQAGEITSLPHSDLVQLCLDLSEREWWARYLRAAAAIRVLDEAGAQVTERKRVLDQFCAAIRYTGQGLQADIRIVRVLGLQTISEFPDLTRGHLRAAVERTAYAGELDEPGRYQEARRWLEIAAEESLRVRELRERIEGSTPREPVEEPEAAPVASDPEAFVDALMSGLVLDLETWAKVRTHQIERLREVWG